MVLAVLLLQGERTSSDDLQPGADGYSASPKLRPVHPMGTYTSFSVSFLLLSPAASDASRPGQK